MAKVKEFQTRTVNVELERLKLDLSNVRFQHTDRVVDDKKMEELIWKESSTRDLCEQIKRIKKRIKKRKIFSLLS